MTASARRHVKYHPVTGVSVSLVLGALLLICVLILMLGCSPGPAYDAAIDTASTFVHHTGGPKYEGYLRADPTLTPPERQTYLDELAQLRSMIDAARAERTSR